MAAKLEEDGERGWKREGRNVQRWKTEDERHSRGGREEEEMKRSYNSDVFFFFVAFHVRLLCSSGGTHSVSSHPPGVCQLRRIKTKHKCSVASL